jgi:hypothetical protein
MAHSREKKRAPKKPTKTGTKKPGPAKAGENSDADRSDEAIALVLDTAEDLASERGVGDKLWGSMIKQTLKRRRPGFHESFYGFRSFSDLLEEAESRGQLELEMDDRSGSYVIRALTRDD